MENEDREVQQIEELEDSSDDEGYKVPVEWRKRGFGNPLIQDGRRQE